MQRYYFHLLIHRRSESLLDRNTKLGAMAPASLDPSSGNEIINDVDPYKEPRFYYSTIELKLKNKARKHPNKISFGTIGLHRSESSIESTINTPGHSLVYYATPDKVIYIDAQE